MPDVCNYEYVPLSQLENIVMRNETKPELLSIEKVDYRLCPINFLKVGTAENCAIVLKLNYIVLQ